MFSGLRESISPTILAVATVLILFAILFLISLELLRSRSESWRRACLGLSRGGRPGVPGRQGKRRCLAKNCQISSDARGPFALWNLSLALPPLQA